MQTAFFPFATFGAMLFVGFVGVHTSSAQEAPSKHDGQLAAGSLLDDDFGVVVQSSPPSSDRSARPSRPEITPILISNFPPLRSKAGECTEKKPMKAAEGGWSAGNVSTGVRASTNAKAEGRCDVNVTRRSTAIPVPTPYSAAEIEVDVVFVCKGKLEGKSFQTGLTKELPTHGSLPHATCEASVTVKPNNGPATVIPFARSYRLPTDKPSFDYAFRTKEVIPLPSNSSSVEITLQTYSRSNGDGNMKSIAAETSITNGSIRLHRTR